MGAEERSLAELLGELGKGVPPSFSSVVVTGIACDSREIAGGEAFFCCRGLTTDGHRHAAQAVAAGARAVVAEEPLALPENVPLVRVESSRRALALAADRFYGSPSRELSLLGVTGTNGKTTVCYLVHNILEAAGIPSALLGTVEYRWGGERRHPRTTTPDALELHRLFREIRSRACRAAVMEVSSHGIAQDRVAEADFDVAVFTNLSRDHLDFHGTLECYRETKARFFAREAPYGKNRTAVLNLDDPVGRELAGTTTLPVVGYGTGDEGDVRAKLKETSLQGTLLDLHLPHNTYPVKLGLVGGINVSNAAAAAAAATALGLGPAEVVEGLETLAGVPGRWEIMREGQPFGALVDYAHTPDALERLLSGVRELARGPVTVVFGCGGDRDRGKRPLMGAIACRRADRVIITNDNPRSEEPAVIAGEVLAGCRGFPTGPEVILDRREAIRRALGGCPAGGVVVVAGKGHEDYQLVGDERRSFDDRREVRAALRSLGYAGKVSR